jgi:hypothetical protein
MIDFTLWLGGFLFGIAVGMKIGEWYFTKKIKK